MPPITLWFLQASRCIRTAWLLEELDLDYEIKFSERTEASKAPEEFKSSSGNPLGKFPTLRDGDLAIYESGAITEYLCERYDKQGKMIPSASNAKDRIKVLQWVHAAEATFALHALAILYARWNIPKDAPSDTFKAAEKGMSVNVQNDLKWLEDELTQSPGRFLVGDQPTAADIMMQFSIDFMMTRQLGTHGEWPSITRWMKACEESEGYKKAVAKTGHKL